MKNFLVLFLLVLGGTMVSQPLSFDAYYDVYIQGYKSSDLAKMKEGSENLMINYSDEFAGYYLHSYYQILKGDLNAAQMASTQALNIQPLMPFPYFTESYIQFLNGNTEKALQNLEWAMQLSTFQNPQETIDDMVKIETFTKKDLSPLKNKWLSYYQNNTVNINKAIELDNCVNGILTQGKKCANLDALFAYYSSQRNANPLFQKMLPLLKAVTFYYGGNTSESINQFEYFLEISKNNSTLVSQRGYALYFLSVIKNNSFNKPGALVTINDGLSEKLKLPYPTLALANMQLHKIQVLAKMENKQEEKLQTAYQLEQTATKINNDYFKAKAFNSIGAYHIFDGPQAERTKAGTYLTKAYNLAKAINDKSLINEVSGNLVVIKAKQGLHEEAKKLTEETVAYSLKENDYAGAQNLYNNLGFLYYNQKDYKNAIAQFEKSIALADKVKENLTAKQKLEYTNTIEGVYAGMIMSCQYTKDVAKLFSNQEQSRSGYLKEQLNKNIPLATISDAQQLLQNDEVLINYSIGQPGEIIMSVITKDKAEIRYSYPIDELLRLKKAYTNKAKKIPSNINPYLSDLQVDYNDGELVRYATKQAAYKKEDFVMLIEWTRQLLKEANPQLQNVQNDFLHFWYNLTLQPIQDILISHPKVIISAADELNYLPFEAFLSPKNQYFVSTHDVKYIPNTTIWKIIANRKYAENRKSVIAFGGALYQPSGNVKPTARGIEDFYKISDAVNQKINKGIYNFKPELEAIGFGGANYLEGTLKEVQFIGTLSNDIKVFTGLSMSESNFKKLNANGELKQYKNLIISTHGFTGTVIPEFSGVMFSQPNGGDGKEDTFLLAPEIAKLNLNADLVVLSACDTGIGKLYGGEGINGLNSSFLVAGSNATMLSLWPVNDAGTALTMQNLFKKVVQENAKASTTLNQIKRAFINGDFGERYKHPQFWAPFLYNGI